MNDELRDRIAEAVRRAQAADPPWLEQDRAIADALLAGPLAPLIEVVEEARWLFVEPVMPSDMHGLRAALLRLDEPPTGDNDG